MLTILCEEIKIQTCPATIAENPVFPRFEGAPWNASGVKAISNAAPITAPMHWLKM